MKQNINLFQADLRATMPHSRSRRYHSVWITGMMFIGLFVVYICTAAFFKVHNPELAQEKVIYSRLIEVLS